MTAIFSFDDIVAPTKTGVFKAKKAVALKVALIAVVAPVVKKAVKGAPVRKHVRQNRVKRLVRLSSGVTSTLTFKRVKAGVIASMRGAAASIIVTQRDPQAVPADKLYRAAVEYSTTNIAVYYGATERAAFKRAAAAAWN
jgi:hypothetical protein